MTTKTTRRNIDIVSKEEWKALVKAQELNRTHLLRSGMGTGTGIGDYGQYHNVMLQGNTFMGSTSGVYSNYSEQIQDDYYDFYNSVSTASATLHGIGFSIGGNTVDEEGNPISFSYWSAIMDIRLACGATYDPFHNSVSINPSISTF